MVPADGAELVGVVGERGAAEQQQQQQRKHAIANHKDKTKNGGVDQCSAA